MDSTENIDNKGWMDGWIDSGREKIIYRLE